MTTEKTGGLTLADLAGAGVDMRITKKELIDLLCEQAKEDLEARLKEVQDKVADLSTQASTVERELYKARTEARVSKSLESATDTQKKTIRRILKDLKSLAGVECELQIRDGKLCVINTKDTISFGVSTGLPAAAEEHDGRLSFCELIARVKWTGPGWDKDPDVIKAAERFPELRALYVGLNEACRERDDLMKQLREFDSKSKQFRTKVMRELLGASESGKKVLDMLDSVRTTAAMHKQLESGE